MMTVAAKTINNDGGELKTHKQPGSSRQLLLLLLIAAVILVEYCDYNTLPEVKNLKGQQQAPLLSVATGNNL